MQILLKDGVDKPFRFEMLLFRNQAYFLQNVLTDIDGRSGSVHERLRAEIKELCADKAHLPPCLRCRPKDRGGASVFSYLRKVITAVA